MTPTPPSPEDDILDLSGLDAPAAKSKASTQESDFEKELEALFAEDLAQTEADAAAKSSAASAPAQEAEEALLLQELLGDAPVAAPNAEPEDILDLSAFAAPAEDPAAIHPTGDMSGDPAGDMSGDPAGDEDVLDLSAFAADGPLDLTPPSETPGGKDGDIDIEGLDNLISDLGDGRQPSPAAPLPAEDEVVLPAMDAPHDDIDIAGLDDMLNVPKAAPAAVRTEDEALDLALDDLLGQSAAPAENILDLTLPDLSEPEPNAVLSALDDTSAADALAAEAMALAEAELSADAGADLGGILDLSADDGLSPAPEAELGMGAQGMDAEDILGAGDLELGELMDGFDAHMPEVASEASLDAGTLLDGLDADPAADSAAPELVAEHAPGVEPQPVLQPGSQIILTPQLLDDLQKMLAELKTQVLGGSVTVVGMQGQLAQKDQVIAAMEARLIAAEAEATALREELTGLRGLLEEDGKTATQVKERLALLEDRQAQMDQDMRAEIERAVPREAAKVIREEIAALAESMRD